MLSEMASLAFLLASLGTSPPASGNDETFIAVRETTQGSVTFSRKKRITYIDSVLCTKSSDRYECVPHRAETYEGVDVVEIGSACEVHERTIGSWIHIPAIDPTGAPLPFRISAPQAVVTIEPTECGEFSTPLDHFTRPTPSSDLLPGSPNL